MGSNYAPQRRELLALHHEVSAEENGLVIRPPTPGGAEAQRQRALSVPESVRALGEPLDPFFAACGGRQTISLSVRRRDGRASPETYVFQQPFVLIGRCPDSDLSLDDGGVSFRHFYLQLAGGRWLFVDLPGASGVPGEKGRSISGWFDPGDELTAGPFTITHVAAEADTSTAISTRVIVEPALELPSFELALVNARSGSQERRIPRITTSVTLIGASRQCDVWLKDKSVSRVHASLVLTTRGLWIVDLLGRDGVKVDGHPAYWKQLHNGSIVQIGRFRFSVQFGAARAQSIVKIEDRPKDRKKRRSTPAAAPGGSMSEGSVMTLVKHLTEMQSQFFEHSQLQTQLITEMLSHLGRAQQTTVRQDLARIDEIGRELNDIKTQLAQVPEGGASERDASGSGSGSPHARPLVGLSPPVAAEERLSVVPDNPTQDRTHPVPVESSGSDRSSSAVPAEEEIAGAAPKEPSLLGVGKPAAMPSHRGTSDAHAWLSQRMANLAHERNSRWRHILNVFNRKPASPTDE